MEASTKVSKADLLFVVEILLSIRVEAGRSIKRTIRRVEIEEVKAIAHLFCSLLEIATKNCHVSSSKELAISKNRFSITDCRIHVTTKRHVELALAVYAI